MDAAFATVSLVAVFFIIGALTASNPHLRALLDNVHWTIGYVGAAGFAWVGCKLARPENRRNIPFIACGLSLSAIGQIIWDIEFGINWHPFSGVMGVFFAVGGFIAVFGICRELFRIVPSGLRATAWIDLAELTFGQFAVLLVIVLPLARRETLYQTLIASSSPIVIIVGISSILLYAVHGRARLHWSWIAVGVALGFSSLAWISEHSEGLLPGHLVNASFTITVLVYGIASIHWNLTRNTSVNTESRNRISMFLPLIAVSLAAFAHLLAFSSSQLTWPERWLITVLFFLVILFGLLRQTLLVAALDDSQTSLLLAQKGSNDGLWDWRIVTGLLTYSDRFSEMLGYGPKEFPARFEALLDDVHPDDASRVADVIETQLTESGPFNTECRLRTRSGEYRWFLLRGQSEIGASGTAHRMSGVISDITEMRQAQEALHDSEARFKQIVDATPMGMILLELVDDSTLVLIDANPASSKILGIDTRALIGLRFEEAFPGVLGSGLIEQFGLTASNGSPYVNHDIHYREGPIDGTFEVHAVQTVMMRVAVMFMDVTERKAAEQEAVRLNEVLEERIEARTAQLRATNDELEAFAYSVSHDLRAPLRGLDGFALFLDERLVELGLEDERHYTARLRSAAKRMGEIIDSLLMLSRVTRGQLRVKEIDLGSLFHDVADDVVSMWPDREVEWRFEPTSPVNADAALMRTLADNLLRNALKYTQGRGKAVIEFGESSRSEKSRVFYVRDNGVGFDARFSDQMFRPFQRLHPESQFEGTGIGLATVSRIVSRHGGSVRAEGVVNEGATIYFELPNQPRSNGST